MDSSEPARRAGALGSAAGRAVEPGPNSGRRGELSWVLNLVPVLMLVLCSLQPTAGNDYFEVQMAEKNQSVVLNENATISCKIIKNPGFSNLDRSIMGVTWYLKTKDKKVKPVFEYFGNHTKAYRSGAHISLENLERGDASLILPKVQLKDAGEYFWKVVVTPYLNAQGNIFVAVIASPISFLYPKQYLVKEHEDKSILCTASRFFPGNISLHWKKKMMKDPQFQEFSANVTGGPIIKSQDGTFNVSRSLNLKLSLADNLTVFQCVIEHPASGTFQVLNFTLIIQESVNSVPTRKNWLLVLIVPLYFLF